MYYLSIIIIYLQIKHIKNEIVNDNNYFRLSDKRVRVSYELKIYKK